MKFSQSLASDEIKEMNDLAHSPKTVIRGKENSAKRSASFVEVGRSNSNATN